MSLSPKFGLVLSGLTGVGKSTLQSALLREGCWTPLLFTSREVDDKEGDLVRKVPQLQLIEEVETGKAVAPVIFGGNLYAWPRGDFERLQREPAGAVLTTRPYTALLLTAAIPKLIPVWLDLSDEDRRQRLAKRGAVRDRDTILAQRRLSGDDEDVAYRELFRVRMQSDQFAFKRLVQLLEGDLQ